MLLTSLGSCGNPVSSKKPDIEIIEPLMEPIFEPVQFESPREYMGRYPSNSIPTRKYIVRYR